MDVDIKRAAEQNACKIRSLNVLCSAYCRNHAWRASSLVGSGILRGNPQYSNVAVWAGCSLLDDLKCTSINLLHLQTERLERCQGVLTEMHHKMDIAFWCCSYAVHRGPASAADAALNCSS